jgi:putative glutamine amidotransferase
MTSLRPLVGITACRRFNDAGYPIHQVLEKYITAVTEVAGVVPMLIPALGDGLPLADVVAQLDGLMLTGSPSNVEPHHYDGPPPPDNNITDPHRDATTLPLIKAAVAAGVPVLGICRGLQELNVALGGTLHQQVQEIEGRLDHRAQDGDENFKYRPVHPVALTPGGLLAALTGRDEVMVNSLHGQGIDRPAPGVVVEALAPDGQVEAIRREGEGFCFAVQWHPEHGAATNPVSRAVFEAFGKAARARAVIRRSRERAGGQAA